MWYRSEWKCRSVGLWNGYIVHECGGDPPIYTLQSSAIIHDVISNIPSVFLTLNQRSYEIEDDNVVLVNLTNAIFLKCSIGRRDFVRISAVCELVGT